MVHRIKNDVPEVHASAYIAPNAEVAGRVSVADGASVWFSASVRGDIAPITIGKGSNVQDGAVVHCDIGMPCAIGEMVTVGHGAILHSCTIADRVLVGMGAIVLNGASIGEDSIVGAGALVTQGKAFPPRSMILGSPAKLVRELTAEEVAHIRANAEHYAELARTAINDYEDAETL